MTKTNASNYKIVSGSWDELKLDAQMIRTRVFIQEQNIAAEDEWDEQDSISLHFIVYDDHQAIATARLLQNNSIGRVAVLSSHRGLGIGKLLMLEIIQVAKNQGRNQIHLSAQEHAIPFYNGLGFKQKGEFYLDCGIPHIDMDLSVI
ncbi:GNAT family N-acetyltransferase [Acinetobacter faecalis]|uniref:GNAT family N-acetyltransferase n=1 Tax=Acinetobacter faecalis TaxID=2665161 RepID=UPI002A9136B8|nr:GNAT family N-acetyltransferase [Acinetobacter faecalis]MDY6451557.1 GNAT family N-acetyltransferase [Acinetobacter faecalis]MDY6469194.1 GNAT family N-acetyltransferase [Acinetobacter faecalis]